MYKTISRLITLIMATKRISSHLILYRYVLIINQTYLQLSWCFDYKSNISTTFMMFTWVCIKFFTTFIIHNFIKKEEYRHLHGRCENIWLILKRDRKCQCHIWTQLLITLCLFRIGARLNHYQYHLIWEPGCHRASFISNSQLDFTFYHSLLSFSFQKSKEIFIKW